uniref:ATP synthase complex subunit 8 n=1 Tax=Prioninae sp. MJTNT-2012 TaxID=1216942 RepID=U3L098_9CUCU|nr:ATP synthase F0 subunit 8 [Prioninae sp. MJTNT-2012]
MPQMAPLNWLTLFFIFLNSFFIFNSMNYFSYLYTAKTSSAKNYKINYNWKW